MRTKMSRCIKCGKPFQISYLPFGMCLECFMQEQENNQKATEKVAEKESGGRSEKSQGDIDE